MQLLYRGFDGLDVSFVGQISHELCQALEASKEAAQRSWQPSPLEWNGVSLLVSETGARGGYAYRASTGSFGATWFFKKPHGSDPWGLRVSCSSFSLALGGLGGVRAELYRTLDALGVATETVSIGRVDYATDWLAPDFVLTPHHFVMHSNAIRADHIEHPEVTARGNSGRVTSVTVGKMPGRQVIVYDKRAEVISRGKVGWWQIWNAARDSLGLQALNPADPAESRVWRVELRAGKKHLKERWNIRNWSDLDARLGDMLIAMVDAIRHTRPTEDINRSRWPDSRLWSQVRQEIEKDLFEMRSGAEPDLIKYVELEAHDKLLAAQMVGLLITRAGLSSRKSLELPEFARAAGEEMAAAIMSAPARFEQKLASAAARYSLGLDGSGATPEP